MGTSALRASKIWIWKAVLDIWSSPLIMSVIPSSISSATDGKWYKKEPSSLIKIGSLKFLESKETFPLIRSFHSIILSSNFKRQCGFFPLSIKDLIFSFVKLTELLS